MAVVKLSTSKKALVFIDDEGNVFTTSMLYFNQLMRGEMRTGFILMSRMPMKASIDRFKPSPLYSVKGSTGVDASSAVTDALSDKGRASVRQARQYTDDKIVL